MKLMNVKITAIDNGYEVRGSYLGDEIRYEGSDCRMQFGTLNEALSFVNSQMAQPEDVQAQKEAIRTKLQEELGKKRHAMNSAGIAGASVGMDRCEATTLREHM